MQKLFSCLLMATAVVAGTAEAGDLNLTIANGRVTLIAHDVTVRQILDEWARVGQTKIVNGDKLLGAPLTIELRDVPEATALETVLRSAAGLRGRAAHGRKYRCVVLRPHHDPADQPSTSCYGGTADTTVQQTSAAANHAGCGER